MYEKFLNYFTDYIFVKDEPQKADVIFVPETDIRRWRRSRTLERRICAV